MMSQFFHENIYAEDKLEAHSFRTEVEHLSDATHYMDSSHAWLNVLDGTTHIIQLPDARTLDDGQQYYFANDTTNLIDFHDGDSTFLTTMGPNGRGQVFLDETSTAQGKWYYQVTPASALASYSIYGVYGGNALAGRYLEIYPGEASNDAPYIVVANLAIVALTLGTTTVDTGTVGVYLDTDLVNPIVTATLNADKDVVVDGIFIPVLEGARIVIRVVDGSAALSKPYLTVYFSGI